jgi:uncharacterized protein (DUF305 family)
MENKNMYVIVGVLAGIIVGIVTASFAVNNQNYGMMGMMGMRYQGNQNTGWMMGYDNDNYDNRDTGGMNMSMNQMSNLLATLDGDKFDQEFLTRMIDHHQGAIDMAQLVIKKSDRPELIQLANDIISAQTKEIEMMQKWQKEWK